MSLREEDDTPVDQTPVPTRLWHEHAREETAGRHRLMRRLTWLIALEVAAVAITGAILLWLLL